MAKRVNLAGVKRGMMAEMWDWGVKDGCSEATVRVAMAWHFGGPIRTEAIAKEAAALGYEVAVGAEDGRTSENCGREIVRVIMKLGA